MHQSSEIIKRDPRGTSPPLVSARLATSYTGKSSMSAVSVRRTLRRCNRFILSLLMALAVAAPTTLAPANAQAATKSQTQTSSVAKKAAAKKLATKKKIAANKAKAAAKKRLAAKKSKRKVAQKTAATAAVALTAAELAAKERRQAPPEIRNSLDLPLEQVQGRLEYDNEAHDCHGCTGCRPGHERPRHHHE